MCFRPAARCVGLQTLKKNLWYFCMLDAPFYVHFNFLKSGSIGAEMEMVTEFYAG